MHARDQPCQEPGMSLLTVIKRQHQTSPRALPFPNPEQQRKREQQEHPGMCEAHAGTGLTPSAWANSAPFTCGALAYGAS